MRQSTNTVLMIRPASFKLNEQTAVNNYYQKKWDDSTPESLQFKALQEFDGLVEKLKSAGVSVIVVHDTKEPETPDSVFPNNWISFHESGEVVLYPMFAENRRLERREDVLDVIEQAGFEISDVMDYTSAEEVDVFLEGTGSVVLDRENNKAYCALSPRSNEELFIEFCEDFDLNPILFEAFQTVNGERKLIYHTNVMMSICETFAVLCYDSVQDKQERKMILENLKSDGKEVIFITEEQVAHFAGNILQLRGTDNKRIIVMSSQAFNSLSQEQVSKIEKHGEIIHSNLEVIETCGGGSARCMLAEVFLPTLQE